MEISNHQQTTVDMPNPRMTTENAVSNLRENLMDMPKNMRLFSVSMRSLYSTEAVGTSSNVAQKFRALRDNTRQDAILYLNCYLPISTKFVSSLKEFFEYYEALSYEEWCEMLPDIREETATNKQVAQTVLEMHEELMTSLKKREDEATVIMKEFKNLQNQFEDKKQELERAARGKIDWALTLCFVPGINLIACPLLESSAKEDTVRAIAQGAESKLNEAAALVVANTLIPALSHFINGLKSAAGFFQTMEKELQTFEDKAARNMESPKQLHYKVMSKKAAEMKSLCQAFYAALPDVRTDFAAIPKEGTDQNYIDKWLGKQLAELEKKRGTVQKFMLQIFKSSEAKTGDEAK